MSLQSIKKREKYPFKVYKADTFLTRLVGLLGTVNHEPNKVLHLIPCSGIHTIGMKYPIDIVFLNKNGCVVKVLPYLKPNKIVKRVHSAKSVLELPSGSITKFQIQIGETLRVFADEKQHPDIKAVRNIFHWPINIFIALLWSRFVFCAINDWIIIGGPVHLSILVHNTLLFFLFLTRRMSIDISHRILDWIIPFLTLSCTMILRPAHYSMNNFQLVSEIIQGAGIVCIIFSLCSLGRSFGIIPANRSIKYLGAYKWVRHPLYASELIFYFGFFLGHPSTRNLICIIMIFSGQLWRSIAEENFLSKDFHYRHYLKTVRYRFIPGLF